MKHNDFLLLAFKQGRTLQHQSRDWYDWTPKDRKPDLTIGAWRLKPGMSDEQAAPLLKALSDGKTLQFLAPGAGDWMDSSSTCTPVLTRTHWLWRVKDRHQAVIDAFERGEPVQYQDQGKLTWHDQPQPSFVESLNWRIKPEPTPKEPTMPTFSPHHYAEAIHAYADGKPIQFRSKTCPVWTDYSPTATTSTPCFSAPELEWRPKHKWQHVIDAAEAGKAIQYRSGDHWYDQSHPSFAECVQWRIRPRIQWTRIYLDKTGEPQLAWTEEKSDLDDDGSDLSNFVRWLDDEWREHELEG